MKILSSLKNTVASNINRVWQNDSYVPCIHIIHLQIVYRQNQNPLGQETQEMELSMFELQGISFCSTISVLTTEPFACDLDWCFSTITLSWGLKMLVTCSLHMNLDIKWERRKSCCLKNLNTCRYSKNSDVCRSLYLSAWLSITSSMFSFLGSSSKGSWNSNTDTNKHTWGLSMFLSLCHTDIIFLEVTFSESSHKYSDIVTTVLLKILSLVIR